MRKHQKITGLAKRIKRSSGATQDSPEIDVPDDTRLAYRRAREAILANRALIVVDGKGGHLLRELISLAAQSSGRVFVDLAPARPGPYRIPWDRLSDEMIATLLVPVDEMCDAFHRRRAQVHVMQVVRFLRAARFPVNLSEVVRYRDPIDLMSLCRRYSLSVGYSSSLGLIDEIGEYVNSITSPCELAGYLEYLRILANSDISQWFGAPDDRGCLDVIEAIKGNAVLYFDVSAHQWPLFRHMLVSAIGVDLVNVAENLVGCGSPATVLLRQSSDLPRSALEALRSRGRASEINVISPTGDIAHSV
jgi:hypothetical protein